MQKVRILTESLPFIKEFAARTIVIKLGGEALKDENVLKTIIEDIALMKFIGIKPVVVHGGGVEINEVLNKMNTKTQFVQGLIYKWLPQGQGRFWLHSFLYKVFYIFRNSFCHIQA